MADREAVLREIVERFSVTKHPSDSRWIVIRGGHYASKWFNRYDEAIGAMKEAAVREVWDAALEEAIEHDHLYQYRTHEEFAAALRQQKTTGGKG